MTVSYNTKSDSITIRLTYIEARQVASSEAGTKVLRDAIIKQYNELHDAITLQRKAQTL